MKLQKETYLGYFTSIKLPHRGQDALKFKLLIQNKSVCYDYLAFILTVILCISV